MTDILEADTGLLRGRRIIYLFIAFPLVLIGGVVLIWKFNLGWTGSAIFVLFATVMTVLMIKAAQHRAETLGSTSPAMRRYNRRMMIASIVYMLAFFLATSAYNQWHLSGPLLWIVALVPAVAVLGMVWAMARLIVEESDEYLRYRLTKQALFATGGLLAITTVWGFLEQFALVPHVPAWACVPIFALMLGLGQCVRWVRS